MIGNRVPTPPTERGNRSCPTKNVSMIGIDISPIQVKQKDKAGRPDIDAFEAMMMREDCEKGFFVSFDYSSDALQEIESFFKRSHKVIVALTVQEILDEHIAKKLV